MPALAKTRRTKAIQIQIKGNRPRLFVVPENEVKAVIKVLSPFELTDSVPIDVVFPDFRHPVKGPAARLRGARARMGITQTELARRTGIRQSHLSEMERCIRVIGKKVAQKLALALKTDYRVFL